MSRSIRQRKPRVGAVLCVLAFAACGEDTPASTPVTPAPTRADDLHGVVVDGYIEGARVFLDLNGNYTHDDGEPISSTTDAQGNFTLSLAGITAEQRERAFIAADVPETAKDSDDKGATLKEAGKNAFTLLAPLPRDTSVDAGASAAVVSPLAALVASEMISSGTDLNAAKAAVQEKLGLTGRELLADFVANPDPVLQNVARVAAVSLGDALRATSPSDGGVAAPAGQRVADALENVRMQLPTVVDALGLRDGGTAPTSADVLREWAGQYAADAGAGVPPILLPPIVPPILPTEPRTERDAATPTGEPPAERDAGSPTAERDAGVKPTEPARDAGAQTLPGTDGGVPAERDAGFGTKPTEPVRDAGPVTLPPAERDAGFDTKPTEPRDGGASTQPAQDAGFGTTPMEKDAGPLEPPVRDVPRDAGLPTDEPAPDAAAPLGPIHPDEPSDEPPPSDRLDAGLPPKV